MENSCFLTSGSTKALSLWWIGSIYTLVKLKFFILEKKKRRRCDSTVLDGQHTPNFRSQEGRILRFLSFNLLTSQKITLTGLRTRPSSQRLKYTSYIQGYTQGQSHSRAPQSGNRAGCNNTPQNLSIIPTLERNHRLQVNPRDLHVNTSLWSLYT